jgi:hypothetical protein
VKTCVLQKIEHALCYTVIGLMDAEYIFSGFWKFTSCQIFKSRLSFHHGMHKKVNGYYIDRSSCTCNYWGLEVSNDDWSLNIVYSQTS